MEDLDTLISGRELALGQEVDRSPVAIERQADSLHSKFIAHPREACSPTVQCVAIIATDQETAQHGYEGRAKRGNSESQINPPRIQKYL